jgi:pimeloyl-ACP methyl ester carboxylesterase
MNDHSPIPGRDFGGEGPFLHFAHANAYPPGCYRQFLEALSAQYHVVAMEQRPLWRGEPPADLRGWQLFADDLIRFLQQEGQEQVIGVGHSLGAVVSMMAAVREPQLFRALVLIEPVFLPPELFEQGEDAFRNAFLSLVKRTRRRRNRWPSREAAFEHFRPKSVFNGLTDAALWDYIDEGLCRGDDGQVHLRIPREWEAHIYSQPPPDVWTLLPQISQPTVAIRAADSDTLFDSAWARWQTLQPQARFVQLDAGTHLVPLEQPPALARKVLEQLAHLELS